MFDVDDSSLKLIWTKLLISPDNYTIKYIIVDTYWCIAFLSSLEKSLEKMRSFWESLFA